MYSNLRMVDSPIGGWFFGPKKNTSIIRKTNEEHVMNRDELRSQIFSGKKRKTRAVNLFGGDVEIRQPTLRDIIKTQNMEDRSEGIIYLLISYCYVPGSDEKVFEPKDAEELLNLPFDESFSSASVALTEMIGVNIEDAEGN